MKDAIICYHSFYRNNSNEDRGFVSNRTSLDISIFASQVEWLNKHYQVVKLEELIYTKGDHANPPRVAITFDDGYYNNLSLAFPLLKEKNIPFTWFVATKFIDEPTYLPWWDLINYTCEKVQGFIDLGDIGLFDLSQDEGKLEFRTKLQKRLISSQLHTRMEIETRMTESLTSKNLKPKNAFCTKDEIAVSIKEYGDTMDIQAHTHSHINLGVEKEAIIREELNTNINYLKNLGASNITGIAYPYGQEDKYTEANIDLFKNDLKWGVTTKEDYYVPGHVWEIPRITITPKTTLLRMQFMLKYLKLFQTAVSIKNRLV